MRAENCFVNFELAALTDDGQIGVLLAPEELFGSRVVAFGDEGSGVILLCYDVIDVDVPARKIRGGTRYIYHCRLEMLG